MSVITITSQTTSAPFDLHFDCTYHHWVAKELAGKGDGEFIPQPGLALHKLWRWNQTSITYTYLDGYTDVQDKVDSYIRQWARLIGVEIRRTGDSDPSDIRISFKGPGNWSALGNTALNKKHYPNDKPTLMLGDMKRNSNNAIIARLALHEFGHALGLVHEHQNPTADLKWNKPAVYRYFRQRYGWSEKMVNEQVFKEPNQRDSDYDFTPFDPDSIMLYAFPAELFTDGRSTKYNIALSKGDAHNIQRLYPKRGSRTLGNAQSPALRQPRLRPPVFKNSPAALSSGANTDCCIPQKFSQPYTTKPRIIVGLSSVDLSPSKSYGVDVSAIDITSEGFNLMICKMGDCTLNYATATWVEIEDHDSLFQSGSYTFPARGMPGTPPLENQVKKDIYFAKPFSDNQYSDVLVWISGFEIDSSPDATQPRSIFTTVYNDAKHKDHFTLTCGFYVNAYKSVTINWMTIPNVQRSKIGVLNGEFGGMPHTYETPFTPPFDTPPLVFTALSGLNLAAQGSGELRLTCYADQIKSHRCEMVLGTWGSTDTNGGFANWVAFT